MALEGEVLSVDDFCFALNSAHDPAAPSVSSPRFWVARVAKRLSHADDGSQRFRLRWYREVQAGSRRLAMTRGRGGKIRRPTAEAHVREHERVQLCSLRGWLRKSGLVCGTGSSYSIF